MTTSASSEAALRAQATRIVAVLKAAERGEAAGPAMVEARKRDAVKFGIVMDDKVISMSLTWTYIRDNDPIGIVEYIIRHMQGKTLQ
jgi:hypothetical protein